MLKSMILLSLLAVGATAQSPSPSRVEPSSKAVTIQRDEATNLAYFHWQGGVVILTDSGAWLLYAGSLFPVPDMSQLPGAQMPATVGSDWCWSPPTDAGIGMQVPQHIAITGGGGCTPLHDAVEQHQAAVDALKAAGWEPVPASECE